MKDILTLIKTRRSIRKYTGKIPSDDKIKAVLEAGRWAPSGLNNQPWKFVIIKDKVAREKIAAFSECSRIIKASPALIVVCLDIAKSYNRDKDLQAIGACIQNMLLTAHSLGLGACWVGEILKRKDEVAAFLKLPGSYELMAVITLGYPRPGKRSSSRLSLSGLIHK